MILDKKMKGSSTPQQTKTRNPATATGPAAIKDNGKDAPPADKGKGGTNQGDPGQGKDAGATNKGAEPGSSDEAVDNNNISGDLGTTQPATEQHQQQQTPSPAPATKRRREQAATQAERKETFKEKRRSAVEMRRQSGPAASSERREVSERRVPKLEDNEEFGD